MDGRRIEEADAIILLHCKFAKKISKTMNENNINYDDDLSLPSRDTPEPDIPEDMTEERALEIWLRKDDEIRARLERVEELRRETEGDNDDISLSSSSHGDPNLPPAIPASQSNSDAWQRALALNPCDPNDPEFRSSWLAYEHFLQLHRPGLADNFVASTPGLARMIDEQRERDRVRRALEAEEEQEQERLKKARREEHAKAAFEQRIHQEMLHVQHQMQMQQHQLGNYHAMAIGNHDRDDAMVLTMASRCAAQTQDPILAAQAREYLRISQAHLNNSGASLPSHIQVPSSVAAPAPSQQEVTHQDPILAQAREYERLSQAHHSRSTSNGSNNSNGIKEDLMGSKKMSGESSPAKQNSAGPATTEPFYLATPNITEHNTRAVMCGHCKIMLYTHPLASTYFCQRCCQLTRGGDARQGMMMGGYNYQHVGSAAGFEEKMMDAEDHNGCGMR